MTGTTATDAATGAATDADTATGAGERVQTTQTLIEDATAVLDALRAYTHLPRVVGFSISNQLSTWVTITPGGAYSIDALHNVAAWAAGLGLTVTLNRRPAPELLAEKRIAGFNVRIHTFIYNDRVDEIAGLLADQHPYLLPQFPPGWTSVTLTPEQMIGALHGHPDLRPA